MDTIDLWLEIIGESLTLVIMLFSLAGLIIPIFPGTLIIWVVALIYGIASGFGTVGWIAFAIMTALAVLGAVADNLLMGAKAHESGASWTSILLALGGALLGTLIFPPVGGLIAAPLLLYISERQRVNDHDRALETVKALAIGWGWSFFLRFAIGAIMILLWGVWAITN